MGALPGTEAGYRALGQPADLSRAHPAAGAPVTDAVQAAMAEIA